MPGIELTFHGWLSLGVTAVVLLGLIRGRGAPPELLFLAGLVVVTIAGVIAPEQALAGFANPAVLTIGALFAVTEGLRATGVLDWLGHRLLGSVHTERGALRRLAATLGPASAFLLNTPVVAMTVPVVVDWCRKNGRSPSQLLIPVSYLTILGGVCTLIGTSPLLVVDGMLKAEYSARAEIPADLAPAAREQHEQFRQQVRPLAFFEPGYVGLPIALVGTGFLLLFARRLLPNRTDLVEQLGEKRRDYLVEMRVQKECRLVGQSVEAAGLRHLPGLFLIEIDRDGRIITPVAPTDIVQAGDRLVFTGVVTTILDLEKIPGLVPAADSAYLADGKDRAERHLTEAVLSRTSPLIGTTVRQARFRERYNAAVVAVHRNGARLTNKIGNIELEPGDTLLLQTSTDFAGKYRHSRDFYLVSSVEGSDSRRHDRALIAVALVLLLAVWLAVGSLLKGQGFPGGLTASSVAAITVAVLMVLTRCLSVAQARGAIDLQVLITIAAALGLGRALSESGAAEAVAQLLVGGADGLQNSLELAATWRPYLLMIALYLFAMVATELITNTAVAAMLFPLAVKVAWLGDYSPRPFVMAMAIAASLSFLTPVGYQTNLMVMGPGGYQMRDYLRAGAPLAALVMFTALLLIPQIWPFGL